MTTQVSFTADQKLKNKALQKAKLEGITLKALLIYAMKSFVDGKISFDLSFNDRPPELIELSKDEVDESLLKKATAARKLKKSDLISI